MVEILKSGTFDKWLGNLKDREAKAKILVRLNRMAHGNPGDVRSVGRGISEMRIDSGPGYRVYFLQRGVRVVILLCGGDKSTQQADIATARLIAEYWREQ